MTPNAAELAEVVVATIQRAIGPLSARLANLDERFKSFEAANVRERLAILETRAPVPGPPGADGKDGAPGVDGLGFDDLSVDFDGERTVALKFQRGAITKVFPLTLPLLRYCGTYQDNFPYVIGDVVTSGGNAWHCQQPTTIRPGDSTAAWRLMVRKGRDGKDSNGNGHNLR